MRPAPGVTDPPDKVAADELERLKKVTYPMPDFISAEYRRAMNRVLSALPRLIAEVEHLRRDVERREVP